MENKSIISNLFTDKELEELNFSQEEIDTIEEVEASKQALSILPNTEEGLNALFERIEAEFPAGKEFSETFGHYQELIEKDPKFIEQIASISVLLDTVVPVPTAKIEKISPNELKTEKNIQISEAQKRKFAAIDEVLKSI